MLWTALLLVRFGGAGSAGEAACDGTWAPFVVPPLLYASGLPLLLALAPVRDWPGPRQALFGGWALLAVGTLTVGLPWTCTAGVCVTPARVTEVRLLGSRSVDLRSLREVRRDTTPTADRLVLGELVIPLRRGLGRGRAVDPEGLARALVDAFHRAGAPP